MKWVGRALDGLTTRTWTLKDPPERLLSRTYSGKSVTVATALGLAPFYRGVQLLSGSVGMLPCKVYRDVRAEQDSMGRREFRKWLAEEREAGRAQRITKEDFKRGRVEAGRTTRAWTLLHDKPNPEQAADEFWALVESHLDTWGNAFIWKERNSDGTIVALWVFSPSRMQVGRLDSGQRFFVVDGDIANPATDFDFLHIRALGSDGLLGYSPVALYRQGIGSALARQEFEGRFWSEDTTPGGGVALVSPEKLSPDAVARIKALWSNAHKGLKREVAVLGEGMKVERMTVPLRDAQYIEGKQMDATEQALILGIPPYMVAGLTSSSLTYSTTEAQSLDLLKWTLSPRLVRIQNAVTWDPDIMPSNWFAEFETAAILRTTTKERYEAYALADWMTDNEKRDKENMPQIEGGDVLKPKQGAAPAAQDDPAVTVGNKPTEGEGDNGK